MPLGELLSAFRTRTAHAAAIWTSHGAEAADGPLLCKGDIFESAMRERQQFRFVATVLFVIGPAMIVVGLYAGRVLLFIGGVLVVACAVFGVWGRKR